MLTASLLRLQNLSIVLQLSKQMVLQPSISTLQETVHLHLFLLCFEYSGCPSHLYSLFLAHLCDIFFLHTTNITCYQYPSTEREHFFSSATALLTCQHICMPAKIVVLEVVNVLSQSLSKVICCQHVGTYCLMISHLQYCSLSLQSKY